MMIVATKRNLRSIVALLVLSSSIIGSVTATTATDSLDEEQILHIRDKMNEDGYVVVRDMFDREMLNEWTQFANTYFQRLFRQLHDHGHIDVPHPIKPTYEDPMNPTLQTGAVYSMGVGYKPGFQEIVHRHPGRYELSLVQHFGEKDNRKDLHDMPQESIHKIIEYLSPIATSIFNDHPHVIENNDIDKYNVIYSILMSTPGSQPQNIHVDTKHLSQTQHYPSHCFNVFIPLINITSQDLGPTEVIPKSHIYTRYKGMQQELGIEKVPPVSPLLNVGDILLFDYRTLHRGLSNAQHTYQNRPILVVTFSIPTFHDVENWPKRSLFENNFFQQFKK